MGAGATGPTESCLCRQSWAPSPLLPRPDHLPHGIWFGPGHPLAGVGFFPRGGRRGPQSSRHPLTRAPEAGGLAVGGHAEAHVFHESQTRRRVVHRHRWKGRKEGTGGKRAAHTSRKVSGRGDPLLQGQKPTPQNQNWSLPYGACSPGFAPQGQIQGTE